MIEGKIFTKVNKNRFGLSGAEIARLSGLDKSAVSRFLSGKTDITLSKFFKLVRSMPPEFQQAYWEEVLGEIKFEKVMESSRLPWEKLIAQASSSDIEDILNAIATRWRDIDKSKEKELASV